MSLEYCRECDKMIDLDYDSEHEHFEENLKTLKDLVWKVRAPLESGKMEILNNVVMLNELKAEAIKWVKIGSQIENIQDRAVNNFIIHFFNISEEDLKEEVSFIMNNSDYNEDSILYTIDKLAGKGLTSSAGEKLR